ncbi:MAG: GIY-YIG nuclease family protein [Bacteroidales bacterium]|nr:MAG: GIY-YIG nuclease family protein [Bacteroidales bacterium]
MIIYVYIVKCSDASYYTGVTNNIEKRIREHNSGINNRAYTYSRRPVELVYFEQFSDPYAAFRLEKQIKGWTRRKKEALIRGDYDRLVEYSRSYDKVKEKKG